MENLIKCSQTLYDQDISNKMAEITNLKTQLEKYKKPQIIVADKKDWDKRLDTLMNSLETEITEFLSSRWGIYICYCLDDLDTHNNFKATFFKLTNNEYWSKKLSQAIINVIKVSFSVLEKTGGVDDLSDYQDKAMENFIVIIMEEIYDLLISRTALLETSHLFINEMAVYKCSICGEFEDFMEGIIDGGKCLCCICEEYCKETTYIDCEN